MHYRLIIIFILLYSNISSSFALNGHDILSKEQAFQLKHYQLSEDKSNLSLSWEIAPEYYLYQHRFQFKANNSDIILGQAVLPQGISKHDEAFGDVIIYRNQVDINLPIRHNDTVNRFDLTASWQGCADQGVCYPPQTQTLSIDLNTTRAAINQQAVKNFDQFIHSIQTQSNSVTAKTDPNSNLNPNPDLTDLQARQNKQRPQAIPNIAQNQIKTNLSEEDKLVASLKNDNVFWVMLSFFGFGVLLAFTPCVFPMIPILSSLIVGQNNPSFKKALSLSIIYVMAMAIVYTIAGILAGLFGQNLQAQLQNPWVISIFSGVFVLLALSMFGLYDLQVPASIQAKITQLSNQQKQQSYIGTAIMGGLSALIVGPCVAPPLAGALMYIGQTGDAMFGGIALLALSFGMGLPLIVAGVSSGQLLVKSGHWMNNIKAIFGVLLLGLAIWLLERILPASIILLLWGLLFTMTAIYMGAIEPMPIEATGWKKLQKGLGLAILIYGCSLIIGASAGGSNPLQPLETFATNTNTTSNTTRLKVTTVKNLDQLQQQFALAKIQQKPLILDFYADWCGYCKTLDRHTFSDPNVQQALDNSIFVKADVTELNAETDALKQAYNVYNPPSILFFNKKGIENKHQRIARYVDAKEFLQILDKAFEQ